MQLTLLLIYLAQQALYHGVGEAGEAQVSEAVFVTINPKLNTISLWG